jgi:Fibrobacter succinogenes major domain (Fib_succ_major).
MNLLRKIAWISVVAAMVAGLWSCKKTEEETDEKESMSGAIVYDIPYYVLKGETVTLSASGVTYPREVSYKWYISGVYADTLSASVVTVRFPDSLGVYTVSAFSYADGFYSSSTARQVTTIDTAWNKSLTGLRRSDNFIEDSRDGHVYRYVTIGGTDWFSQNLAWQGTGVPFKASPATAGMFGSFYTWNEAMSGQVCPEGWSVPTIEDWNALGTALNGGTAPDFFSNWTGLGVKASAEAYLNGERMWPYSPDNAHTNDFGWNAIPLGYSFRADSEVSGMNEYGFWWCATERNATQAYYRYIWYDRADFPAGYTDKDDLRASVRCVRRHPQFS